MDQTGSAGKSPRTFSLWGRHRIWRRGLCRESFNAIFRGKARIHEKRRKDHTWHNNGLIKLRILIIAGASPARVWRRSSATSGAAPLLVATSTRLARKVGNWLAFSL